MAVVCPYSLQNDDSGIVKLAFCLSKARVPMIAKKTNWSLVSSSVFLWCLNFFPGIEEDVSLLPNANKARYKGATPPSCPAITSVRLVKDSSLAVSSCRNRAHSGSQCGKEKTENPTLSPTHGAPTVCKALCWLLSETHG